MLSHLALVAAVTFGVWTLGGLAARVMAFLIAREEDRQV